MSIMWHPCLAIYRADINYRMYIDSVVSTGLEAAQRIYGERERERDSERERERQRERDRDRERERERERYGEHA